MSDSAARHDAAAWHDAATPQPGYGQQPAYPAGPPPAYPGHSATGATTSDDRTFGMLSHLLGIVASFVGPLVIFLVKRHESPFVRHQSAEALNFQITVIIAYLASLVFPFVVYVVSWPPMLFLVWSLIVWVIWIGAVVFMIIASVTAGGGRPYRYPINIRMVRARARG